MTSETITVDEIRFSTVQTYPCLSLNLITGLQVDDCYINGLKLEK